MFGAIRPYFTEIDFDYDNSLNGEHRRMITDLFWLELNEVDTNV